LKPQKRRVSYPVGSGDDASSVATRDVEDYVLNSMPENVKKDISKET
jgi:hypothetical protein